MQVFEDADDYAAFGRVLAEAVARVPTIRLLGYCVMPNHWHLVVWPKGDGQLSEFMRWLTVTHTQRWHAHHHTSGTGPVYQGRYRSFPIEQDEHLLAVLRYVERNALRCGLVERAEDWRWGSLWRWVHRRKAATRGAEQPMLSDWPVARPRQWRRQVNTPMHRGELEALRHSVKRGSPFGSASWTKTTARRLAIESTLNPIGRPRKQATEPKS